MYTSQKNNIKTKQKALSAWRRKNPHKFILKGTNTDAVVDRLISFKPQDSENYDEKGIHISVLFTCELIADLAYSGQ